MSGNDNVRDSPFESVDREPGDPGVTQTGVIDRLFDGSAPGPPVPQLESDYRLPFHWAVAGRGFVRTAVGEGVPPIFEILIGSTLGTIKVWRDRDAEGSWLDREPGVGNGEFEEAA